MITAKSHIYCKKEDLGLKDTTYCKVYPTSAVPSKFYGLPKIHKVGTP